MRFAFVLVCTLVAFSGAWAADTTVTEFSFVSVDGETFTFIELLGKPYVINVGSHF